MGAAAANNLYFAGIKIGRGSNADMPSEMTGAIATCFAAGADYQTAVRSCVTALKNQGFEFVDISGEVKQIPAERWDDYVSEVWPEAKATLPNQAQLGAVIATGGVFFGPFLGFES
jgi:hypothetical protein